MLQKSGNYIVYLLKWTSAFGLQQERLYKTDLSGLKLSVNIANPCSKLLHTEVRETFRRQTLYV